MPPAHPGKLSRTFAVAATACSILAGCGPGKSGEDLLASARQLYARGDKRAAQIELKNALQKTPDNGEARVLLGTLYNEAGDAQSAAAEFRRAIGLGYIAGGQVYAGLGRALVTNREYQKVIDEITPRPLFTDEGQADVHAARGHAYLMLNRTGEARAEYDAAVKLIPGHPDASLGQARLRLAQDDIAAAVKIIDGVLAKAPNTVEAWMLTAEVAYRRGSNEDAIAAYDALLKIAPDHVSARIRRALTYMAVEKPAEAQQDIDYIRRRFRNHPVANYIQALIHFRARQYTQAQSAIQESLRFGVGDASTQLLAATIHYALGAFAQAEQGLTRFTSAHPENLYARRLLASTLIEMNQGKRALEVIDPALAANLDDPALLALAGNAHMKSGDYAKATRLFEQAAAADPVNSQTRAFLALSRLGSGDYGHAIADLERAIQLDPKFNQAEFVLVIAHLRNKAYEQALQALAPLERKQPGNPIVHNLKGTAYLARNDAAAARKSYERALALQPVFMPALLNLATLDMRANDTAAARRRFETVLGLDKKNETAMLALAEISAATGNPKDVLGWLERARQANPDAIEPRIRLIRHHLVANNAAQAVEIGRETLGKNPENPRAIEMLARAQMAQGDRHSARAGYRKLVSLNPDSPEAHLLLAGAESALGERKAAEAGLRKALALSPGHVEASATLAWLLARSGRPDEALSLARGLRQRDRTSPLGYDLEGDLLMEQKKYAQAAKAYETALDLGKSGALVVKIDLALARAGNPAAGEALLSQWLKEHPGDLLVHMHLGDTQLTARKWQPAAEHYRIVAKGRPDNALAWNNLAFAQQQLKDPGALESAEKAHAADRANPAIMDTLGWILVERGEFKRGLALLQSALAKAPDTPDIRYHAAVALAKSGDKAGARKQLEQLLASGKRFAELEDAKAFLKQL